MSDETTTALSPKAAALAKAREAKAAKRQAEKEAAGETVPHDAETGEITPPRVSRKVPAPPPPARKWTIGAAAIRKLPPPGEYDAKITDIGLHDKGSVLWMAIKYELTGAFAGNVPEAEFAAIAAAPGSEHEERVPEGSRILYRTAAAAGVDLPADLDADRLPDLLEGKTVRVKVAHKTVDGVPALVVRRALPKKVA